jgi:hypothetical protein
MKCDGESDQPWLRTLNGEARKRSDQQYVANHGRQIPRKKLEDAQ